MAFTFGLAVELLGCGQELEGGALRPKYRGVGLFEKKASKECIEEQKGALEDIDSTERKIRSIRGRIERLRKEGRSKEADAIEALVRWGLKQVVNRYRQDVGPGGYVSAATGNVWNAEGEVLPPNVYRDIRDNTYIHLVKDGNTLEVPHSISAVLKRSQGRAQGNGEPKRIVCAASTGLFCTSATTTTPWIWRLKL